MSIKNYHDGHSVEKTIGPLFYWIYCANKLTNFNFLKLRTIGSKLPAKKKKAVELKSYKKPSRHL